MEINNLKKNELLYNHDFFQIIFCLFVYLFFISQVLDYIKHNLLLYISSLIIFLYLHIDYCREEKRLNLFHYELKCQHLSRNCYLWWFTVLLVVVVLLLLSS